LHDPAVRHYGISSAFVQYNRITSPPGGELFGSKHARAVAFSAVCQILRARQKKADNEVGLFNLIGAHFRARLTKTT
jgi:hypothetical protein